MTEAQAEDWTIDELRTLVTVVEGVVNRLRGIDPVGNVRWLADHRRVDA
jgi:hypothetical protein